MTAVPVDQGPPKGDLAVFNIAGRPIGFVGWIMADSVGNEWLESAETGGVRLDLRLSNCVLVMRNCADPYQFCRDLGVAARRL